MPTEREANHAKNGPGAVPDGEFVGAERHAMELLQMTNRALDDVALPVARAVKAAAADRARVGAPRQYGTRAMPATPRAHRSPAVAPITGQRIWVPARPPASAGDADAVKERGGPAQVVRLARLDGRRQWEPAPVGHEREFRTKPAATPA